MQLRAYQNAAVNAAWSWIQSRDDNPCIVIPTGGGKTPVITTLCSDAIKWGRRVMVVAHVKELLNQSVEKIYTFNPELAKITGVYSAGLDSRETDQPIIIAGIQSVYNKAHLFGHRDLVIVDEAHRIPNSGSGQYQTFFADLRTVNPQLRIIGLTATPYRTESGMICDEKNLLNGICYEISIRDLIRDGYLSDVRSKAGSQKADLSNVHIKLGEFVASELEKVMCESGLVQTSCGEIIKYTQDRKKVLIFASGVDHGILIRNALQNDFGVQCGFICGDLRSDPRDETIERFRNGNLKYLVNVNVLTVGFDAPNIDCVAILRPTMSPGLFYQMVGRGFRICEDKENCLVLDFGNNVSRHGPVDKIVIKKRSGDEQKKEEPETKIIECPRCHELLIAGTVICPDCGEILIKKKEPEIETKQDRFASNEEVLSIHQPEVTTEKIEIINPIYRIHIKKHAPSDAPRTLEVCYYRSDDPCGKPICEYICFEHDGYAREKAVKWWKKRTTAPVPNTIDEAYELANAGALAEPTVITVRKKEGDKFYNVTKTDITEPKIFDPILYENLQYNTTQAPQVEFNLEGEQDSDEVKWGGPWATNYNVTNYDFFGGDEVPF